MPAADSTSRFSNRVQDYVRYRPGYPEALVDAIAAATGLTEASVVADIGSGTGISAALFLRRGCTVYAVEPNADMRAAAEALLDAEPGFRSVAGTAEATTLPDRCADATIVGQALHWFDIPRTRAEFARILRPPRWVAVFWNNRQVATTPFLRDYEALLQTFGTDYQQINHRDVGPDAVAKLFGTAGCAFQIFPNAQVVDLDGLRGRLLSSSYIPPADDPRAAPMLEELGRIFDRHAVDGRVAIEYDAELYLGRLEA